MPALLFGIGVFALFAGLAMVGFGVPINEFSFGNTLIRAGTTAAVGGLIIIGLSVVVGQLRRVAEALALQPSARLGQPTEAFESAAAVRSIPAQGHIPISAPAQVRSSHRRSGPSLSCACRRADGGQVSRILCARIAQSRSVASDRRG